MLKGVITALVTPFKKGNVDFDALERLIEFQIKNNIDGILIGGTTGESPTYSDVEFEELISFSKEKINGRTKLIAGTGTNDFKKTLKKNKIAEKYDCDAVLVITPYYNKPTQNGLEKYFKAVSENTDRNIIIYNVPGRTSVNILPETVAKLADIKNITDYKAASGNIEQISEVLRLTDGKIDVLSGDDGITYPIMSIGGKGVISVLSNIMPKELKKLVDMMDQNDFNGALKKHFYLSEICKTLFIETNPIPVKTALSLMGYIDNEFRLPLCELQDTNLKKLKIVLSKYGLI